MQAAAGTAGAGATLGTGGGAAPLGFGPDRRLAVSADFERVFRGGRRRAGRFMVMWFATGAAGGRAGVVVSKRTFRRAVDRARAKRLMREAFRLNRAHVAGAYDLVLVARRGMLGAGLSEVQAELLGLARRAGILAEQG